MPALSQFFMWKSPAWCGSMKCLPLCSLVLAVLLSGSVRAAQASASPWGADYFPNVSLTTSDGRSVRFFDDLIKDKIVAINFIYTSCPDTCPLETAQLVRVQQLLGDRLGRDVFFYSISIDPETDTPAVLAEYRERFGARWTFLTGDRDDIIDLRRKLGLYVEEIQDGSNNHNVSMIIGNQATGRWMRRSPFENPYVLADQIGNWLDGWKAPPRGESYAQAPELRSISDGEQLFRTRCANCHTLTGHEAEDALGPDLLGVTRIRDEIWLLNWLRAPDQVLASGDPIAVSLFERYNRLPMPNMRLNRRDAEELIAYLEAETIRLGDHSPAKPAAGNELQKDNDVVGVLNAWVRETRVEAPVNAGYMTLVNPGAQDIVLVRVDSPAFETIEVHEMSSSDGLMSMRRIPEIVIPANGQVRLEPGGTHLMLMNPEAHFRRGQKLDLTLTFKSGLQQAATLRVAAR